MSCNSPNVYIYIFFWEEKLLLLMKGTTSSHVQLENYTNAPDHALLPWTPDLLLRDEQFDYMCVR